MAETEENLERQVLVKAYFKGEWRRTSIQESSLSIEQLVYKLKALFGLTEPIKLYSNTAENGPEMVLLRKDNFSSVVCNAAQTRKALRVKIVEDKLPRQCPEDVNGPIPSSSTAHLSSRQGLLQSCQLPQLPTSDSGDLLLAQTSTSFDQAAFLRGFARVTKGGSLAAEGHSMGGAVARQRSGSSEAEDAQQAGGGRLGVKALEKPLEEWHTHVISSGKCYRLVVQTRSEEDLIDASVAPRCQLVVAEVNDRLAASKQFSEEQMAMVRHLLCDALGRLVGTQAATCKVEGLSMGKATADELNQQAFAVRQDPLKYVYTEETRTSSSGGPWPGPVGLGAEENDMAAANEGSAQKDSYPGSDQSNRPHNAATSKAAQQREEKLQIDTHMIEKDSVKYAAELKALADMGFADDVELYLRLLKESPSVNVVVNRLLEG